MTKWEENMEEQIGKFSESQKSVTGGLTHRIREAERTLVIRSKILIFIKEKTEAQWWRGMLCSKSLKDYNTFPKTSTLTDTMELSFRQNKNFANNTTTLYEHPSLLKCFNKYLLCT